MSRRAVQAYHTRITFTLYHISDNAFAIVIVYHMHHLALEQTHSIHERFIYSDTAHVVKIRFGDSSAMYF
jgi:hypothetical protein